LRSNLITPFNGLILVLFIITAATGRWQNALFGQVIIYNSAVGVIQELRARRTLAKLSVVNESQAMVVRDGAVTPVALDDIVADDLVELRIGDQVPADGIVRTTDGIEVDESELTGESDPINKLPGDQVRSGSAVVAGSARYQVTAVGDQSYAAKLAADARRFSLTRSELVAGTNKLLRWISIIMVITAPFLIWSQFRSPDNHSWQDAVTGVAAGLIGMIPEGLVLLTTLAFVVAIVTLAKKKTLVQELPAVEGLARVDIVCLDKTGTLTHGDSVLHDIITLPDGNSAMNAAGQAATADPASAADAEGTALDANSINLTNADLAPALALLASDHTNASAKAIAADFPDPTWTATATIPFSSLRKWSAVETADHGTWVMGAPEMVFAAPSTPEQQAALDKANELASTGGRVLVVCQTNSPLERISGTDADANAKLPDALTPIALVILAERIREDAAQTLHYFAEQGVALKVISGDNPRTVGAVALRAGVPGITDPSQAFDARELPEDPAALADAVETHTVFGRVTPAQKRAMVKALQSRGHVVAMTGDGVNDALALKDADIGVAMGSGSAATRAVAQLVLMDDQFAHLPEVVGEGRRVIANIERAANLFLIKNVYSLVLVLLVAITGIAFPFAPIQLTLISTLAIGIPGMVLALGPNQRRYQPGFVRRVLKFAIPVGTLIAAVTYFGIWWTHRTIPGAGVDDERTIATVIVVLASIWTLLLLARPLNGIKLGLVVGLLAIVAVVLVVPAIGHGIFLLTYSRAHIVLGGILAGVAAIGITIIAKLEGVLDLPKNEVSPPQAPVLPPQSAIAQA